MPLFTSNSEAQGITRRQAWALLSVIAFACLAVEAGTWWWTHKISWYMRRFDAEYSQALGLRHGGTAKSVLIVGNSTLRFGVDMNGLQSRLGPGYECHVLSVDATTYPDWYFGLKELFRKGSQPDYVVIMLPANNVLEFFPVPEFSPYYLIAAHDIPALAVADHLNASAESDVAFEHFSVFFASRNALRAVVKRRLFPGFEEIATKYMKQKGSARLAAVVTNRMRELRALCEGSGTRVVYIVPPTNQSDGTGAERILALAHEAGMMAAMPVPDKVVPTQDYLDGFHLNDAGRDMFTAELANYLREHLANPAEGPMVAQVAGN